MKAVWIALVLLGGGVPTWEAIRPAAPIRTGRPVVHIRGDVSRVLRPGLAAPLRIRATNRSRRTLRLTRLHIRGRVDARHLRAGCRRHDYAIRPVSRHHFPLRIRPLRTVQLRARVRMRNPRTRNQDACKGARLHLRYRARVRR